MASTTVEHVALTTGRYNRRSLLKRADLLGLGLPAAGLLLNACSTSASIRQPDAGQPSRAQAAGATPVEITITASDLKFEPANVSATAGQRVRLTFVNTGKIKRDWLIEGLWASGLTVVEQQTIPRACRASSRLPSRPAWPARARCRASA